jgi:hypothetical protein
LRRLLLTAALALAFAAPAHAGNLIPGTNCPAFRDDTYFHADVSTLPKHVRSDAWMANAAGKKLHPDFGPSFGELRVPYGLPITVVDGSHPKVTVDFEYATESDNVPYPLNPSWRTVEGGSWTIDGDRHTITVDKSTCKLYETFATRYFPATGRWTAGSGAVWDLNSYRLRPNGWTSADAAGLPIMPLLLRYEEVVRGNVDHAIRFTLDTTANRHDWPARHHAGVGTSAPPMGARFRLKKNFPIASYRADTQTVLRAMKKYGLVLADNGSDWFFQGTADNRWEGIIEMLDELKSIPASAFEAVDTSSLMISGNSMRVPTAE